MHEEGNIGGIRMTVLLLGLLIFLGAHSVRIVAAPWREAQIARHGERRWKGLYALASLVGLVLVIHGYGLARAQAVELWTPPAWAPHAAGLLTALAFVLVAAAYAPPSRIRTVVRHPMVAGVLVWAIAHLLANGTLADLVLFGAFLIWAAADFVSALRRGDAAAAGASAGTLRGDIIALVAGLAAWALFALLLHGWLTGVRPFH